VRALEANNVVVDVKLVVGYILLTLEVITAVAVPPTRLKVIQTPKRLNDAFGKVNVMPALGAKGYIS
jgi:hypothetical protein